MARRTAAVSRRCSIRRAFLPALAFVVFFAASGAAEPRTSVVGTAGVLAGSQSDPGPAFSLRVVRWIKHPVSVGLEAASGIAQEIPINYLTAAGAFAPVAGHPTERLQFLDGIVMLGSRHGPYAILGAGVYDRVASWSGGVDPDPDVSHTVAAGFSGGVGYASGARFAPMIEYRVHVHGSASGTSAPGSGSTLKALGIGSAGLMFRF